MKCEYCGRALSPTDWQCPGCGAPVEQKKEKASEVEQEKQTKNAHDNSKTTYGQGPNYNNYYEKYQNVDRGQPIHISAYGGFGSRFIAEVIDLFIIALLCEFIPFGEAFGVLIYIIYEVLGNSYILHGATLGKRAMGIKVVNANFEELQLGQATARQFCKLISWAISCLGFVMIIFSKRRQSLHDRIVGSYVIKVGK